ncbi:MAG: hypothetical protein M1423_06495 [Acidobacteria bacterium]|nr:hypothetical protein [Acidobacteriota bacterium]
MAQEPTTQELLAAIAQHDEAALALLYDLAAPSLYGLITTIVSDGEACQELLKEVFIRLWKDANRIQAAQSRRQRDGVA